MRSPASPWSATSRRSPVPIKRPRGILPGGKVFQLPPPALEAKVPLAGSAGTGCAGSTGTGVALETDEAMAIAGPLASGALLAEAGGAAAGFAGVLAEAREKGVGVGAASC